jgi:hypothetical protein
MDCNLIYPTEANANWPLHRRSRARDLQLQIERMLGRMRLAVVYAGEKSAAGAVINTTANPRSWKSYESVAHDIGHALRRLALPWHFGSVLRNPPMAVRTTMWNHWRSEQLGDDGAADLRQRGLRRRSVGGHLFPPDPQP